MKKTLHCVALVFLFLLVFVQAGGFLTVPVKAQGLEVNGNGVVRLTNFKYDFEGDIVISGNGTLYVENATINLVQRRANQYKIVLENPSGGHPRLIVKNSSFTSTKVFGVFLYGNSIMDAWSLTFKYKLELHDTSSISVNSSDITYFDAYDNSSVSVSGSVGFELYAYDFSDVTYSASTIYNVYTFGSSKVSLSVSEVNAGLYAEDSSAVFVSSSKITGNIFAKGNSRIEMSRVRMDNGGQFRSYNSGNIKIMDSNFQTTKVPIEFSMRDSSAMYLLDLKVNNAWFNTYNSSVLSLDDVTLVSVWLRSEDNSNVNVLNSSVRWLLNSRGFSYVSVTQSSLTELLAQEYARVEVSHSNVSLLRIYDFSNVSVSDSTIDELSLGFSYVNCSLDDLGSGRLTTPNFTTIGDSCFLNITNTEIAKGWDLKFSGSSNVTLTDSIVDFLGASDFVSISIVNSTLGDYFVSENAKVFIWSYLTIRVVDYFGNPVTQANVTVSYANATLAWKLTDNNGLAMFKLYDRMINSTGTYSEGSYGVSASSSEYSNKMYVELFGSTKYMVTLPSPWWYWYAIVAGIAIAVGLVFFFGFSVLRKRFRKHIVR